MPVTSRLWTRCARRSLCFRWRLLSATASNCAPDECTHTRNPPHCQAKLQYACRESAPYLVPLCVCTSLKNSNKLHKVRHQIWCHFADRNLVPFFGPSISGLIAGPESGTIFGAEKRHLIWCRLFNPAWRKTAPRQLPFGVGGITFCRRCLWAKSLCGSTLTKRHCACSKAGAKEPSSCAKQYKKCLCHCGGSTSRTSA